MVHIMYNRLIHLLNKFKLQLLCHHEFQYKTQQMSDGGMSKINFFKCKNCGKEKVIKI